MKMVVQRVSQKIRDVSSYTYLSEYSVLLVYQGDDNLN